MTNILSIQESLIWLMPVSACLLALITTPVIIKYARNKGYVSYPQDDRWHSQPVALLGGVAIFISVLLVLFLEYSLLTHWLWIGAVIMFLTGYLDDRVHLSPLVKLLAQIFTASLLILAGYHLIPSLTVWISVPLTIFWIIGVTNAVNLLDNMDGLSPGVTAIGLGVTGGLIYMAGEPLLGAMVLSVGAATVGFLIYNFNPARVFMGDSGSLFLGYLFAGSVLVLIQVSPQIDGWYALLIAVCLAIVPIYDTTLVTCNRMIRGISLAQGGKDHVSHRLVFLGLSERIAVLSLYFAALLFAGLVVWSFYLEFLPFVTIFLLGSIALAYFALYMSRLEVYPEDPTKKVISLSNIPLSLRNRVQTFGIGVDLILVVLAFTLAHFIRFESWTQELEQAVLQVAPGVIVIKLIAFYVFGLYKGIWKHAGVMELIRICVAVFIATGLAGVFSWIFTGGYLSISVFAIDFLLLVLMIAGSRFGFKGLRRVFAQQYSEGKNVLLYGAGDAGWLALSEIRHNPELYLNPVGFIDDSHWKQGFVIQGLRVLGRGKKLKEICENKDVEVVLVTISDLPDDKLNKIMERCDKAGVSCKRFTAGFVDLTPTDGEPEETIIGRSEA